MTLHEAIEQLLKQANRSMTTTEIANELNKNKWYTKNDKSNIEPKQIAARISKHPTLFDRDENGIVLKNGISISSNIPCINVNNYILPQFNYNILEDKLMCQNNFYKAADVNCLIPQSAGIYCIKITDENKLPHTFSNEIKQRGHNIIYIGIASQNLLKRLLYQELRANGHGTFFRSIGAVLGFKPPIGSLRGRTNIKNYKFSKEDNIKIINWINQNLMVSWVEYNENISIIEENLINKYTPLLNIKHNPLALKLLSDLRAECVIIANS